MEKSVLNEAPEQTYNDESLLRPMSLANVSGLNDPSTDKSRISGQIWNEYRTPREPGTPLIGEEDVEDDQDTPRVKVLKDYFEVIYFLKSKNVTDNQSCHYVHTCAVQLHLSTLNVFLKDEKCY